MLICLLWSLLDQFWWFLKVFKKSRNQDGGPKMAAIWEKYFIVTSYDVISWGCRPQWKHFWTYYLSFKFCEHSFNILGVKRRGKNCPPHPAPTSVFNLEISQSGLYVPHVILNWVILEMVRVKLWYTKKKLWKINIIKTIQRIRFQFFVFHSLIPLLKWKVGLHEHTALLQVVWYIKLKLILKKWQTNFK